MWNRREILDTNKREFELACETLLTIHRRVKVAIGRISTVRGIGKLWYADHTSGRKS
jgi:hypothetical protein